VDVRIRRRTGGGGGGRRVSGGGAGEDDDNYENEEEVAATPDMCCHCFDALLVELLVGPTTTIRGKHDDYDDVVVGSVRSRRRLSRAPSYVPPAVDCPLFVTWSKLRVVDDRRRPVVHPPSSHDDDDEGGRYDLRGCVGTLSPRSLPYALSEFAVASALHDRRFDPIAKSELPYLRVGVSLLVGYEECADHLDWVVGVHGIIVCLVVVVEGVRTTYTATFLPEVAREQRWGRIEAVISLVRKAGYRGDVTDDLLSRARFTRYRSSRCSLSYGEYAAAASADDDDDDYGGDGTTTTTVGAARRTRDDAIATAVADGTIGHESSTSDRGGGSRAPPPVVSVPPGEAGLFLQRSTSSWETGSARTFFSGRDSPRSPTRPLERAFVDAQRG
ncbi:hypothetical protein ACHAW5_005655, partial [Stephanodiscus triporus]